MITITTIVPLRGDQHLLTHAVIGKASLHQPSAPNFDATVSEKQGKITFQRRLAGIKNTPRYLLFIQLEIEKKKKRRSMFGIFFSYKKK
jgi:hypothetical protein